MSGVYIKNIHMPDGCGSCRFCGFGGVKCELDVCMFTGHHKLRVSPGRMDDCPLIAVPEHSGLFDVGQFEKGCFYGYGRDGKVYKLMRDTKVFDGAKKVYINPIVSADKEASDGS